mmetsp:Transcript_9611/g.22075  ORF Transcript_9611/g.22075 Transcript_9611/m.22075 type:complete len:252 (-) Transcript_9611:159-914(-)|eukprot:CAMPEP_0114554546 /NCGR_PEP_ID=MMETSP0114-20121206/8267_1 /TAXON_ID=31324 /ORGANISM="Goniomonas sp, Strain m" /LENGTH=251 /DNA_ID=CAMNT_0001739599 /DNA_START=36 /DNA_END=791 /DNA_ORIENTATION=-
MKQNVASVSAGSPQYDYLFTVVVIGDKQAGKSSLLHRLAHNKFPDQPTPTVGVNFVSHTVTVDHIPCRLLVWDLPADLPQAVARHYCRGANAVVFVFDVTQTSSFHTAVELMGNLECRAGVTKLLVGQKLDQTDARQVSFAQAGAVAKDQNMNFIETSALDGRGVGEVAVSVVRGMLRNLSLAQPTMRRDPAEFSPTHANSFNNFMNLLGSVVDDAADTLKAAADVFMDEEDNLAPPLLISGPATTPVPAR